MSYYPDITFPSPPEFPIAHEDAPWGNDLYDVIASYIPDMVTDGNLIMDNLGNVEVGAAFGIVWDGVTRIDLSGGEILITALQINTALVVDTPTITTLNVTGDCDVTNNLVIDGNVAVTGTVTADYVERKEHTLTQAAEPGDPANDTAVIWLSNGTGYGDAGDLVCKITEGGGTTDFTIADYSAL